MTRLSQKLQLLEGDMVADLLRSIGDDDWERPTDCTEWSVRDMTAHLAAQAEDSLTPWAFPRRERAARRNYPQLSPLDAYTAQQVADHDGPSGPELASLFVNRWPRAVRAMRWTRPLRRVKIDPHIPGVEPFTVGYFQDAILPRDLWMHRIDLTRAIDQPMKHAPHERMIVEDVIADLASSWPHPPAELTLGGAVTGTWTLGAGQPQTTVEADTVDYMRTLSGRNAAPDLLLTGTGHDYATFATARVAF
jgi:uncharacterized protein (TIGR03083 family)